MALTGKTEMYAGEAFPHIFTFVGASSISSAETYAYRNGQDVSDTVLSDSTSINLAIVTGKIITIPSTGYFGSIIEYVIQCTVDGKVVRPRIWIYVPMPARS